MVCMRKVHRNSAVLWLLALSLGLRSLIAPGFMLNVNGEGPFGLSITLCGGLHGAHELSVFDDPHLTHGKSDFTPHNHEAENGLVGNGCGLWSTSATYVQTVSINTDQLLQLDRDRFQIDYLAPNIRGYHRLQQQPRAPPSSLII